MVFTSLIAFVFPLLLAMHANSESDEKGSVEVYFGLWKERASELLSLRVLLFFAIASIVVAIVGNFV
jgi:hypothetical protein